MKGTLSISWGPYGGFYWHPHRVCLGFVAITWLPNIEIDDLMDAYAERGEWKELGETWGRVCATVAASGRRPSAPPPGPPEPPRPPRHRPVD